MRLTEEEICREQPVTVFCRDGTRYAFSSILQGMSVMEELPIEPIDWIASYDAQPHLTLTAEYAREMLEERNEIVHIQEFTYIDGNEMLTNEGTPQTYAELEGIDGW